jgi:alkylation response protein AidB-like acyl-CoA dehydrogenase
MTITLARIEDAQGQTQPSGKGLSCFIMRVKLDDGSLNNIRIHKLKNKLGTKQLPTAELELLGSRAYLLSDPGRGVPLITTLVNVTRLYNALSSVAGMRRITNLMRDYAHRRTVFGSTLSKNLMHLETLAEAEVQTRAAAHFTFDVAERLGRAEIPAESTEEDQTMLRLLTPLVKLYTAKQAVALASEGLESFGGQGYIEDSKLPRMLRDAQVLPICQ